MSDTGDTRDRSNASDDRPEADAVPGETPPDPAYASGAGFSGEATGATPPDPEPTAGLDPAGSSQPDPARPQIGGAATASAPTSAGMGSADDAKTMAMIAYIANIVGLFTGGVGNLAALILAYVKKDTAPEWVRSHFVMVIRTVLIALIASIALIVLSVIAVPLLFAGVGFVMFPIIALCWVALCAWIVVRSVVGLMKLNENQPYPNPETWLI